MALNIININTHHRNSLDTLDIHYDVFQLLSYLRARGRQHTVKYATLLMLLLFSTPNFSSDFLTPKYGANCTKIESYLADMLAIQERPTGGEGYTSFYAADPDRSPSIVDLDCYEHRLYRATIAYRYTNHKELKDTYTRLRHLLIKAIEQPDEKDPDELNQAIKNSNKPRKVEIESTKKHDAVDLRKYHEQWSKEDYRIKIHITRNNEYGWFLSYRLLPNFKQKK